MAKELVPIVLSCAVWDPLLPGKSIEFKCDNKGLVDAINKGSSKGPQSCTCSDVYGSFPHSLKSGFQHHIFLGCLTLQLICYLETAKPSSYALTLKLPTNQHKFQPYFYELYLPNDLIRLLVPFCITSTVQSALSGCTNHISLTSKTEYRLNIHTYSMLTV